MAESWVVSDKVIFNFSKVKLNYSIHSIHTEDGSRALKRHCSAVLIRNPAERQSLTAVLANSVKSTVEYMQNSSLIFFEMHIMPHSIIQRAY